MRRGSLRPPALCAVLGAAACLGPVPGAAADTVTLPVTWTSAVNVSASGNNLTKTGSGSWNGGAVSTRAIPSGDGYLELTASETTTHRMIGLSNGDAGQHYADVDFALYLNGSGQIWIYEGGASRGQFGAYAAGDTLRVAVEAGFVRYKKNGSLLYTSAVAPAYPLLVDTSLDTTGATLTSVGLSNQAPAPVLVVSSVSGTTAQFDGSFASDRDGGIASWSWDFGDGATSSATSPAHAYAAAGVYAVSLTVTDDLGTARSLTRQVPVGGYSLGLSASYYPTSTLTGNPITRVDPAVDFDWGSGSPASGIGTDNFSVRWTGQVQAQFGETYTFYVRSDDGARLWVNGTLLIDKWVAQGPTEWSGAIALQAGQRYDIVLDYLEYGGGALAQLSWSSASTPKQLVPQERLSTAVGAQPAANVAWTNGLGVSSSGNSLTKTAAGSWNAGASSAKSIPYGDGFVEFRASETATDRMLGLSNGDPGQSWPEIDFAFYANGGGQLWIYENGISRGQFGTYLTGDALRVSVEGGVVRYRRNGLLLYSSGVAPAYPLLVDTSLDGPGATLTEVRLSNRAPVPVIVVTSVTGTTVVLDARASSDADGTISSYAWDFGDGATATGATASHAYAAAGIYAVRLSVTDDLGASVTATRNVAAGAYTTGLKGTYYNSTTLSGASLVRFDPAVDFDWSSNAPVPGIGSDNFSVRWEGQVEPQFSETYTFYTNTDDGVRLWVNGQLLIDKWLDQGAEWSGTIALVAGQRYDLKLEYYESLWGARAQLSWSSASLPKQIIGQERLSGQTTGAALASPVAWNNVVGVSIVGSTLTKTGSGRWDAGASSTKAIASGAEGYVEFRASERTTDRMLGLSNGDSSQHWSDIDYAFYLNGSGQLWIYEGGSSRGQFGTYASGDALRISVEGGSVRYRRNGLLLYTSGVAPVFPLLVDTSLDALFGPGATLAEVMLAQASVPSWSGSAPCAGRFETGDFDGDGRTDRLCSVNGVTNVSLAAANGWGPSAAWLVQDVMRPGVVDYNGDGKDDVSDFDEASATFTVALSTGTSFTAPASWGAASVAGNVCTSGTTHLGSGDFNGDGYPDVFCKRNADGRVWVGLSNGASAFSFSLFATSGCSVGGERFGAAEFDGDGMSDWYCIDNSGAACVSLSTGGSFQDGLHLGTDASLCARDDYVLGDLNGDGRTDLYCPQNGKVALATGNAFLYQGSWGGTWCNGPGSVTSADVDGDGVGELVCNNAGSTSVDIQVRKWLGESLGPAETWAGFWCTGTLTAGPDWNGDGKGDILCNETGAYAVAGTTAVMPDLMTQASNGLGGTATASYTPSSSFANTNNPPLQYAVTSLLTQDGRGGSSTTTYSYSGGKMDRQERTFLGFAYIRTNDPCVAGESAPCPYSEMWLSQTVASAGLVTKSQHLKGSGQLLTKAESTYEIQTSAPRWARLTRADAFVYDDTGGFKQSYTTYQYDAYGNRTLEVANGDSGFGGDELETSYSYVPNTAAYIVDKVARVEQKPPGGGVLGATEFLYDNAGTWNQAPGIGNLTKTRRLLLPGGTYVESALTYDAAGNPTSSTDPTGRTLTATYDGTHQLFPVTVTNAANETVTASWDFACGVPTQVTDANGQAATSQYDALCRPTRTDTPLGGFSTKAYLNLGDPTNQRTRVETPAPAGVTGNLFSEDYFDGLGRVYKTKSRGPSATQTIVVEKTYNARGEVDTSTAPFYENEASQVTSYRYDAIDRLIKLIHPGSAGEVSKSYGLLSETTTDENGKLTVSKRSPTNPLQTIQERSLNGQPVTTTSTYDLLGRLVGMTDTLGHQWSWSVDSLGRTYQKSDPDAGTWSFQHDGAGRLTSQTDAKNQTTAFGYDAVGRLVTKTAPDEEATTVYSEARPGFYNNGRPTTITNKALPGQTLISVLKLDYDAEGKAVKQTRTLDGTDYVLQRSYASGGYLLGLTWPDGDAIGGGTPLGWDEAGRLKTVPNIVSSVTYDASGRPLVQTNANGTTTTRTYSPERSFLTQIQTLQGAATIQNLQYTLDPAGVVTQVTSPFANEGWSYGYDDLYRLTSATNTSDSAQNQTWGYDAISRITNNSRVGNYTYPNVGQPRPHAPLTAGPHSFTNYDGNGNLVVGAGRTLAWDANNRITQATVASTTTTFAYDAFGERVKKTTGANTTRYPFGDDYEIAPDGTVTKYISIDRLGVVAKRVGPVASAQTFWHHTERLGSIDVITDAAGAEVFRKKYRPYGETLAESGSNTESRGWIDQRNDTETGLTYLHARYYDPILGTFTSPDPLHPAVAGVGMHRYGYGLGNPLRVTDRFGLSGCYGDADERDCWDWWDDPLSGWYGPSPGSDPCDDYSCGGWQPGYGPPTTDPGRDPNDDAPVGVEPPGGEDCISPPCSIPPEEIPQPIPQNPNGGGPNGGGTPNINPFVGSNPNGVFNPPSPSSVLNQPLSPFFRPPSIFNPGQNWAGRFERNAYNNLEKELAAFWDGFIPGWDPFDGLYGDCPECQWSRGIGTATFNVEAALILRRYGNNNPILRFGPGWKKFPDGSARRIWRLASGGRWGKGGPKLPWHWHWP